MFDKQNGFVFECAPTNALTWGLFVACLERNVLRTFESTISLSFQREKPSNNNSEFLSFFKNPFVILICLLWLLEGRSNSSSAINSRTDDGVGLLYACPNPTIRYEIWKGPKLKVASYTYNFYLLNAYLIYNAYRKVSNSGRGHYSFSDLLGAPTIWGRLLSKGAHYNLISIRLYQNGHI